MNFLSKFLAKNHKININNYNMNEYYNYYSILRDLHIIIKPKTYFEVGVRNGDSLKLCSSNTYGIGVDPIDTKIEFPKNIDFFKETSDSFFKNNFINKKNINNFDLSFMDGMHLFEFYLRDFINIEKNSNNSSVIAIHDTMPINAETSSRERKTDFWTGDVFKLPFILKKFRPELKILNIAGCYTGLTLVKNLDPNSSILDRNYDNILSDYINYDYSYYKKLKNEIKVLNYFSEKEKLKFFLIENIM